MEQHPDTSRRPTGKGRAAALLLIPVAVGLGIWFVGRGVTPDPNSSLFGARYNEAMEL